MTNEWTTLGSVTTWLSGGTPARSNPAYWGGSVPWISAFTLKTTRLSTSDQFLTSAGVAAGSRIAPEGAALVLVRGMALHRELRVGLATRPLAFNQDVKALVPATCLDPEFLVYSLQSRESQILKLVSSAGSGTGVLATDRLKALPLWLPSRDVQQKICRATRDADDLIGSLERLIAKNREIRQGLIQELLSGRSRISGSHAWRKSTIGEEFHVQLGKRLDAAVNRGELKLCVNNRGVRWGRIDITQAVWAPLTRADISELRLKAGDVLVCEGGEIGRASVWRAELSEAYYLNTLHRLRSRRGYNPDVLAAFLERWATTGELLALVGKSSLAHLTKENLLRVPLPVPSPEEQGRIATALRSIDQLIFSLERLIAKQRNIKQGLMQELLTGRTRLYPEATS
ncbi:restriction endonuclease subunit S [Streptomyces sp. 8K308]|uniref:restriction endonuclease subunit S n=1 Tax=Streptomyces sp. 8K308 TaxID=2530388 RepID=UPI0010477944|nr:restriction endonuclease subunit S [Streptomyces sp. 8K308]TDC21952.1 restriction endonuclease subunit S [Streptomyces sp. 8K308]